ncbi:MAG: YdeI/OmpD-associated family protein [Phaeodactylibacter sp.]|nr:YdeI/OmpD-associated family protein [Phaeodactylibacter sp.]MCB9273410.1 YdeI/OmpD-associated family protein [Lewinellaceae bacterium]
MEKPTEVDAFIQKHEQWREALSKLRAILLTTGLDETIKWGSPAYTLDGKNVVGLGAFKAYVGIWFFQGGLLEDRHGVLVNAQEGKTRAMRQWRFQSAGEIDEKLVRQYLAEAIRNQRAGKQIKPELNKPLILPEELTSALQQDSRLASCFGKLTPGRQREYAEYVGEAKRQATRSARLEKITPMILAGIGLNDR